MNKYLLKLADEKLRPHQIKALRKLDQEGGIVVDHSTGSGKTKLYLTAIAKAQQENKKGQALVIAPASLVTNIDREIDKHGIKIDRSRLTTLSYEMAVNKSQELRKMRPDISIVDEAHKLRNTSTRRTKELRDIIEESRKRVLGTGTTTYNHVSDIAPLVNIASGGWKVLPEGKKQFEQAFVDTKVERPDILTRIAGGHSPKESKTLKKNKYLDKMLNKYVDRYDAKEDPTMNDKFPSSSEKTIEVEMSPEQRTVYKYLEDKLPFGLRLKVRMNAKLTPEETRKLQAFSQGIRQASNSIKPFMKNYDQITPKVRAAVDSLEHKQKKDKNFRGLVYSNYLKAGLDDYSKELEKRRISHAVYNGRLTSKQKDAIVADYNSGKIPVLLVSSAGSEGLDLKGTRLVQVLEPAWNKAKIEQVMGRAIRFNSHELLPPKSRHVEIEHYNSVHPKNWIGYRPNSIDQYLSSNGETKNILNEELKDRIK